jgi:hypothetical protein
MSNKYKALSNAAHEERRKHKMCLDKHPYETAEEAFDKHQKTYKCPYCGKWHRTGQLDRLVSLLRGNKRKIKKANRYKRHK